MEETVSSSPRSPRGIRSRRGLGTSLHSSSSSLSSSVILGVKKSCLSFTVSLQEGFQHIKALVLGQVKKMRARNEREATEADLQAAKMQVDAADAAEDAKRIIDKTA